MLQKNKVIYYRALWSFKGLLPSVRGSPVLGFRGGGMQSLLEATAQERCLVELMEVGLSQGAGVRAWDRVACLRKRLWSDSRRGTPYLQSAAVMGC